MERLDKCVKTTNDVKKALEECDLFRDVGLSGPVSLTEALRMDMSCFAETPVTIGSPSTAWWWFVEDFFRPIGRNDVLKLMPTEEEADPVKDSCFKMANLGPIEGKRTLTECWESFGYTALRKERRSGRLAEKKAFSPGGEVPSAPSADWLELPKEFLKTRKNALEICKDPSIEARLDELLNDLNVPQTPSHSSQEFSRYQTVHPLTQRIFNASQKDEDTMDCDKEGCEKLMDCDFSSHCLSIGPDDEIAAEILKLQESLFDQMMTNRTMARRLTKAALRNAKFERKQAQFKEQKENEIAKYMKIIEEHENKMKEKRAAQKQESPSVDKPTNKSDIKDDNTKKKMIVTSEPENINQSTGSPHPTVSISGPARKEQNSLSVKDETKFENCAVCCQSEQESSLLHCVHCGVYVHQGCYEKSELAVKETEWRCLPCRIYHERQKDLPIRNAVVKNGGALSVNCIVCHQHGGAYERTADTKHWIHAICQLVLSEASSHGSSFGPPLSKRKCVLCEKTKGTVVACGRKNCPSVFHPLCAKTHGTLSIKHKKKKREKGNLYIESMTCGRCGLMTELKKDDNSTMNAFAKQASIPATGSQRKRKEMQKEESIKSEDSEQLTDGEGISVCMFTRSKSKRQKIEEPGEAKTSKPKKKIARTASMQAKQSRKRKELGSMIHNRQMQKSSSQEINPSLLSAQQEKKAQRITRNRK